MIAVVLALGGAISYGVSDFIGGVVSRRTSVWPVAVLSCTGSLLGAVALALVVPGSPTPADLAGGAVAGVGAGAGTAFLYRGLANGRMGVVAPVSGVGATVIPVLIGVLAGERPAPLVWLGMLIAVPGIWLVSREEPTGAPTGTSAETSAASSAASSAGTSTAGGSGLLEGVLAGIGFGLLFACLGQVPAGAGLWPLGLAEATSVLATVVAALALGGDPRPSGGLEWWALAGGLLAAAAGLAFLLATHRGLLSVSAVLVSLYPAFTVLLAALVLREHIHRAQAWGLGLCALAVVLVAAG